MPYIFNLDIIQIIVNSMESIVGSNILNQCSGKKWLLSESIMDIVQIYTYCAGESENEDVSKHLDAKVEERGNSQAVENLPKDLLDVNWKMRHRVKDNLTNVLAPLLNIQALKKYHYWFSIFLDPRYVM